jgi:heme/copper-type cytochrome/quinol oxidase subunit 2
MEKIWVVVIAILIFLVFAFLFWKFTNKDIKKEYGTKAWKHWPSRLSYWQAVILYSTGLTVITMFVLRWATILDF